jgi:beta-lactamase class A
VELRLRLYSVLSRKRIVAQPEVGEHMPHRTFQASLDDVMNGGANIDWAISIRDAAGHVLASRNADSTMKIASVGKLLLLIEVARQSSEGDLAVDEILGRDPALMVADSGLWQHLHVDALPIHDLCVLIAGVSDNAATNVVLQRVGLQRLRELSASLGLVNTAVLDYVRDHRGPADSPTFSTGSASELSQLMSQMSRKELVSQDVSGQVTAWLATGVDLSMVASAFGLDPLSHATSGRTFFMRNKTGTDTRIRADVGTVGRNSARLSYAVIANWDTSEPGIVDAALSGMNAIGELLRATMENGPM